MTKLKYRLNVGIMVINKNKKIWIGKRIFKIINPTITDNHWQMPQGGINKNEDPEAASLRELFEETGIKTVSLLGVSDCWLKYNFPKNLIGKIFNGKFKGQKQIWYCYYFKGSNNEINLKLTNKKSEFYDWKWENIDQITNLIIKFKRKIYIKIIKQFKKYMDKI